MCSSACFSRSQLGNSPVGFETGLQGLCATGGEPWGGYSVSHAPLIPVAERESLGKAFY